MQKTERVVFGYLYLSNFETASSLQDDLPHPKRKVKHNREDDGDHAQREPVVQPRVRAVHDDEDQKKGEAYHVGYREQLERRPSHPLCRRDAHHVNDDQHADSGQSRNSCEQQFGVGLVFVKCFMGENFVDLIDVFFFI